MFKSFFPTLAITILLSGYKAQAICDISLSTESVAPSIASTQVTQPIVTGWEGLDNIDWDKITGWGALKQKPVFNEREIPLLRKAIDQVKNDGAGLEFIDFTNTPPHYLDSISDIAGSEAAVKLQKYLKEIEDQIKARSSKPFKMDLWIRNENSYKVTEGHSHGPDALTITRAEQGQSSWFLIDKKNLLRTKKQRVAFTGPDAATVFTDQFHGGTLSTEPRLLILIFVRFGFRMNDHLEEY